jgi:hypothetical protein
VGVYRLLIHQREVHTHDPVVEDLSCRRKCKGEGDQTNLDIDSIMRTNDPRNKGLTIANARRTNIAGVEWIGRWWRIFWLMPDSS